MFSGLQLPVSSSSLRMRSEQRQYPSSGSSGAPVSNSNFGRKGDFVFVVNPKGLFLYLFQLFFFRLIDCVLGGGVCFRGQWLDGERVEEASTPAQHASWEHLQCQIQFLSIKFLHLNMSF